MTRAYIFVFLLVGIASNRVEPDDDELDPSVFLLQTTKAKDKALPELSDVLEKQSSHVQDVRDSIGDFEKRLLFASQNSEAHIVVLKAHLEENLTAAKAENKVVEQQNADLLMMIGSLKKSILTLRGNCTQLQESNKRWTADLQATLVNVSSAQEFVDIALNDSVEALEEAPELKILDELDEIDMKRRAKEAYQRSMSEVHQAPALLQVDQDINDEGHTLIDSLGDAIVDLEVEQNASKASLMSAFQKDYDALTQLHAELLERQDGLNHTLGAQFELQRRLNLAVAKLQESQTVLQERAMAVRAFEMRIASKPMPESVSSTDKTPVSLLQTSIPEVKDLLQGPGAAFKDMHQQVISFEEQIQFVQSQSVDEISQLQQNYDEQLQAMRRNSTLQQQENAAVEDDIERIDEANNRLRAKADALLTDNDKMREELYGMKENITLIQEFLHLSILETNDSIDNEPSLEVLAELEHEDDDSVKAAEHAASLAVIDELVNKSQTLNKKKVKKTSTDLAFVQLSEEVTRKQKPAVNILVNLQYALQHLIDEHERGEEELKRAFAEESKENKNEYDELVADWARLNESRASKLEIQNRLQVACLRLISTRKTLAKKHTSMIKFAQGLAHRSSPVDNLSPAKPKTSRSILDRLLDRWRRTTYDGETSLLQIDKPVHHAKKSSKANHINKERSSSAEVNATKKHTEVFNPWDPRNIFKAVFGSVFGSDKSEPEEKKLEEFQIKVFPFSEELADGDKPARKAKKGKEANDDGKNVSKKDIVVRSSEDEDATADSGNHTFDPFGFLSHIFGSWLQFSQAKEESKGLALIVEAADASTDGNKPARNRSNSSSKDRHCSSWCDGHTTGWYIEDPQRRGSGPKCSWAACSPCDACSALPLKLRTSDGRYLRWVSDGAVAEEVFIVETASNTTQDGDKPESAHEGHAHQGKNKSIDGEDAATSDADTTSNVSSSYDPFGFLKAIFGSLFPADKTDQKAARAAHRDAERAAKREMDDDRKEREAFLLKESERWMMTARREGLLEMHQEVSKPDSAHEAHARTIDSIKKRNVKRTKNKSIDGEDNGTSNSSKQHSSNWVLSLLEWFGIYRWY